MATEIKEADWQQIFEDSRAESSGIPVDEDGWTYNNQVTDFSSLLSKSTLGELRGALSYIDDSSYCLRRGDVIEDKLIPCLKDELYHSNDKALICSVISTAYKCLSDNADARHNDSFAGEYIGYALAYEAMAAELQPNPYNLEFKNMKRYVTKNMLLEKNEKKDFVRGVLRSMQSISQCHSDDEEYMEKGYRAVEQFFHNYKTELAGLGSSEATELIKGEKELQEQASSGKEDSSKEGDSSIVKKIAKYGLNLTGRVIRCGCKAAGKVIQLVDNMAQKMIDNSR